MKTLTISIALGWNINLTGDYVWQQNKQPKKGEFSR